MTESMKWMTDALAEKVADQRRKFRKDAYPDEDQAAYCAGLEDALRIIRGLEPEREPDELDTYAVSVDPWTDTHG